MDQSGGIIPDDWGAARLISTVEKVRKQPGAVAGLAEWLVAQQVEEEVIESCSRLPPA